LLFIKDFLELYIFTLSENFKSYEGIILNTIKVTSKVTKIKVGYSGGLINAEFGKCIFLDKNNNEIEAMFLLFKHHFGINELNEYFKKKNLFESNFFVKNIIQTNIRRPMQLIGYPVQNKQDLVKFYDTLLPVVEKNKGILACIVYDNLDEGFLIELYDKMSFIS